MKYLKSEEIRDADDASDAEQPTQLWEARLAELQDKILQLPAGYDPVEMFTDPEDKFVITKLILKLLKKKLGFRTVMNIIPLKANLVKGSHGRIPEDESDYPRMDFDGSGDRNGSWSGMCVGWRRAQRWTRARGPYLWTETSSSER